MKRRCPAEPNKLVFLFPFVCIYILECVCTCVTPQPEGPRWAARGTKLQVQRGVVGLMGLFQSASGRKTGQILAAVRSLPLFIAFFFHFFFLDGWMTFPHSYRAAMQVISNGAQSAAAGAKPCLSWLVSNCKLMPQALVITD